LICAKLICTVLLRLTLYFRYYTPFSVGKQFLQLRLENKVIAEEEHIEDLRNVLLRIPLEPKTPSKFNNLNAFSYLAFGAGKPGFLPTDLVTLGKSTFPVTRIQTK